MEKLKELKERLIRELGEYAGHELNSSSLDIILRASNSLKNICYVLDSCEEEDGDYSRRGYARRGYGYRADPMEHEPGREMYTYADGSSYARGRRNATRDAMGRYSGDYSGDGYSGHQDPARDLRELIPHAPDEKTRRELEEIARRMER